MSSPKALGVAAVLTLGAAAAVLLGRRRGRRPDAPVAGAGPGGGELTGRPLPTSVAAFTPHVDADALKDTGPGQP
jgi:hypothetical protein